MFVEKNTMEVNGDQKLFLQNISSRRKKLIQVWNNLMVSNWWQNGYFFGGELSL